MADALLSAQADLGEGVLVLQGEKVLVANVAAQRFLGRGEADLLNVPSIVDLIAPADRSSFIDVYLRRLGGEPLPESQRVLFDRPGAAPLQLAVTTRVIRSGRGVRSVLVLRFPSPGDADRPTDADGTAHLLLQYTTDLVSAVDEAGRYLFASPSFQTLLGVDPGLLPGQRLLDLIHPDDQAIAKAALDLLQRSGAAEAVVRYRHRDRTWHWIDTKFSLLQHHGRRIAVASGRDVTDVRRSQTLLARLGTIVESSADAIMSIDLDGRILTWNSGAQAMYGYTAKEMVGRNVERLVPPGAPDDLPQIMGRLQRGEALANFETQRRRKDGSPITVNLSVSPLREGDSQVTGVAIITRDVSERKEAERRRRTQYSVARILFESTSLEEAAPRILETLATGLGWDFGALWLRDVEGDGLDAHATWAPPNANLEEFALTTKAVRAPRGEGVVGIVWATGKPIWLPDIPKERRFRRVAAAVNQGLRSSVTVPIATPLEVHGVLEFAGRQRRALDEDEERLLVAVGSQVGLFLERQRATDEIHRLNADLENRVGERTAQLETANRELEAFCYSVSHDLRGPLRSIDNFSRVVVEDYGPRLEPEGQELLGRVRGATVRMGRLIDALLRLAHASRADLRREDVDLSAMAHDFIAQLQAADPQRHVEATVQEGLQVKGDADLLRVALENLIDNAWKYTRKREDPRVEVGAEFLEGRWVYFVRDNGTGFDMTQAPKLFVPFNRLHSASDFEGSGIGLATVQRIIQRHGGEVWADAARDRGATFRFTLEPSLADLVPNPAPIDDAAAMPVESEAPSN